MSFSSFQLAPRESPPPLQAYRRLDYYRPQTKLREGYVFTGVCDSVHGGGVRGCRGGGRAWLGGAHRIRRDTVNERAVRILLECILVLGFVCAEENR